MTEQEPSAQGAPQESESTTTPGAEPRTDPWPDVVRSLDELGRAVTAWASAVRDDPENRTRVKELQEHLEVMGRQVGEVADSAMRSDVAKQVGSAFVATGEVVASTAKRVSDEVSPFVASAFRTAAESIRDAAQRIEQRTAEAPSEPTPAPAQPAAEQEAGAAPTSGDQPSAEAPSDYIP